MSTAYVTVIVSDVRKADNGLATGCEAYVSRDGVGEWLDELLWTEEVMGLVDAWREAQRVRSRKRQAADRIANRKPTPITAKEPATIADGPNRGDRIEVCFSGRLKRNWHRGTVTQEPYVAENGRVVYVVQYDNGRIFMDHLSLPWRLYSRPEPRDLSSGPQRHDRIEVAWPSEIDGRPVDTRWIAGKVLSVESIASDVSSFVRYTIYYPDTKTTLCDLLSLPWRPAKTRVIRRVRPRTVEAEPEDAPPLQLTLREVDAPAISCFDLNESDSESDAE